MGADCIANNLHLHVLYTNKLLETTSGEEMFPIEQAGKKLFFKSNLKHKSQDEINMYNCGIRFGEVLDYPMRCLLISPDIEDESTTLEDA